MSEVEQDRAVRLANSLADELVEDHGEALQASQGGWPPEVTAEIARARETYAKRVDDLVQATSNHLEVALARVLERFGLQPPPQPPRARPALHTPKDMGSCVISRGGKPGGAARELHMPKSVGPYVILEEIGSGAFSVTYRGRHSLLDRPVAIKFLTRFGSDSARRRFLREGRALARLNDPHIVGIHDCGERDGQLYLVLEFVTGGSVQDLIEAGEPLPLEMALGITRQLLRGLAAAHDQGILHRDVKPSNLLLTEDGCVKVADFGVARISGLATSTQNGASVGTPLYMAPEQFALPSLGNKLDRSLDQEREVDARSDLYSAGIVLYQLLTGEVPHSDVVSLIELVVRRHSAPPPPPPEVPEWLAAVLKRLLAVKQGDRFQSAREASQALQPASARVAHWHEPSGRLPKQESKSSGSSETAQSDRVPALQRGTAGESIEVVLRGETKTYSVTLVPGKAVCLGRNSVRADLVIPDQRISRAHAELLFAAGKITITDRGSANGTYLNGKRLGKPASVSDGDRIQVGDTTLVLECADLAEAQPNAAELECSHCGESVPADSLIKGTAQVIAGSVVCLDCTRNLPLEECLRNEGYLVRGQIDQTGQTSVFRAMRPSVGEVVAVRVLDREQSSSPAFQERFLRDARALARLRHPNAAWIYDVSETPRMIYVVMRLVTGETLAERIGRRKGLELSEALQILHGVSSACELSEGQGLYHGSLTPQRIMITASGDIKLTGFQLGGAAPRRPQLQAIKLRYVAPERLRDDPKLDVARSEVYALVANLKFALTGFPPHHELSDDSLWTRIQKRSLSSVKPSLEGIKATGQLEPLVRFMRKGLAIDPDERYPSLRAAHEEFGIAIKAALAPAYAGPVEALFSLLSATGDDSSYSTVMLTRRRKKGTIAGLFDGDELIELIQMLGLNARTGSLRVTGVEAEGAIYLSEGRIVGGFLGAERGLSAVQAVARQRRGQFEFEAELPANAHEFEPTDISRFLLNLLRETDEEGH